MFIKHLLTYYSNIKVKLSGWYTYYNKKMMMFDIMNFFVALLLFMYFVYNPNKWDVSLNALDILPQPIIVLINIAVILKWVILPIFLVWYTRKALNFDYKSLPFVLISCIICQVAFTITGNIFLLNDVSVFPFFNIYHPISLELKLKFFQEVSFNAINMYFPELLENSNNLKYMLDFLGLDLNQVKDEIKFMNAKEIYNYVNHKVQLKYLLDWALKFGYILIYLSIVISFIQLLLQEWPH